MSGPNSKHLPPKPELIPSECRRLPLQTFRVYAPLALLKCLAVPLLMGFGNADDVLSLIVLEQLQGLTAREIERRDQ